MIAFLLLLLLACGHADEPLNVAADCSAILADPKLPASPADATARRAQGIVWTDVEVRKSYICEVATIAPAVAAAKAAGKGAEELAHIAYTLRHDARLRARAMMTDQTEVTALQARDQEKYGNPDGPTFDWLVQKNQEKGLAGDALYDAIIQSAQQTNSDVNAALGL